MNLNGILSINRFFRLIMLIELLLTVSISAGFLAGTKIKTAMGYIPIEQLKISDKVICSDFNGSCVERPIIHVVEKHVTKYIKIFIGDECISVTPDHLFYLPQETLWMRAKDLTALHKLLKNCVDCVSLNVLTEVDQEADVYDITVADYYNFCVSELDIHVHNFLPIGIAISIAFGGGSWEFIGAALIVAAKFTLIFLQVNDPVVHAVLDEAREYTNSNDRQNQGSNTTQNQVPENSNIGGQGGANTPNPDDQKGCIKNVDINKILGDKNKIDNHIFDLPKHNLNKLPGNQSIIVKKVIDSILEADKRGEISEGQPFSHLTKIDGFDVECRGKVVEGVLKIGTFFVKP